MNKWFMIALFSCSAYSGELVKDAEIIRIGNSSDGMSDNFFITLSEGTGPCANKNVIFPASKSPSEGFHNRLYSTAMLAYTTGSKKVRIFNPVDDSCTAATYIDISK